MEIRRRWAMPNRDTFRIKPIKEFLDDEIEGNIVIDPMCGNSLYARDGLSNDINPNAFNSSSCMDGLDFLKQFPKDTASTILFDPPYSLRQVKEMLPGLRSSHEFERIPTVLRRHERPNGDYHKA